MSFADNLRLMRKFRGMTQEQLAKEAGISTGSVINYENGRRKDVRSSVIKKLASALGLPESYFSEDAELFSDGMIIGIRDRDKEAQICNPAQSEPQIETESTRKIRSYMDLLNEEGQQEAVDLVALVARVPEYRVENKPDKE